MKSEAISDPIKETDTLGALAQDVHLADYWIIPSKCRHLIFWFTVGAAIMVAIKVFLLPTQYAADTTVLPPGKTPS